MTNTAEDILDPAERMMQSENNDDDSNKDEPKDKYHLSLVLFYAMGMLTLVPSNFFTTANDFWMYKFRNPNEPYNASNANRTDLQTQFTSSFSIASSASNIVLLLLTIIISKKIHIVKRLLGSLSLIMCAFVITVIFSQINTDNWQTGFFVLTLILSVFLTGACGMFMVTVFELAGRFPPNYIATTLSGQSICGIFAALVQIFALSIGAQSLTTGLIYFTCGSFFVFLTIVFVIANVTKSIFFRHFTAKTPEKVQFRKDLIGTVFKRIAIYLLCMVLVLGSNVMIYPGVTSLVVSVDKGNGNAWNDIYFVPVVTFLLYHTSDYIGRELSIRINKPLNRFVILIVSLVRVGMIPLIMFCNTMPRNHLPVAFNEDFYYIIFIIIIAFTHGYSVNMCVIEIIRSCSEEERLIANLIILVTMIFALGACSFTAAALVKLL